MRYQQYKFKFYMDARHAIYIGGKLGEVHPHTWEIVLHVVKGKENFEPAARMPCSTGRCSTEPAWKS